MNVLDVDALTTLASRLDVLDQESAQIAPFVLHDEQIDVLRALASHERCVFLKGRQIGLSTVCCFFDTFFALVNDGVSVAIVADTQDKAKGLLKKCKAWLASIPVPLVVDNAQSIELPNGSTIEALSAVSHAEEGQSRVGRSKSYAAVHCSELAFWGNDRAVFASLTATALPGARVVVESTASPVENLFKSIWTGIDKEGKQTPGDWHRRFFALEEHRAYRADPSIIDDERWEFMQREWSFTRRDSAAWWHRRLTTDLMGDVHAMMREFPVVAPHAFVFASGRWILSSTIAMTRADGPWRHYVEPEQIDEPVVFGVDTSKGVGLDASTIAVLGHRSGRLVATFKSNTVDVVAFVEVVKAACVRYKPVAVVVESNGVGESTWHLLRVSNWPVYEQVSSAHNGEKEVRMRRVKHAIESGAMPVGPELDAEVKHSIREPKRGDWEGPDDLINAVSFALKWRSENMPAVPVPTYAASDRTRLQPLPTRQRARARG